MKTVVGPDMEWGISNHKLLYKCIINCLGEAQA